MSRRLLPLLTGAAVVGALAVRQLVLSAQQSGGGSVGQQLQAFLAEVQELAAEREQELRTLLGLDGRHDAVDADL